MISINNWKHTICRNVDVYLSSIVDDLAVTSLILVINRIFMHGSYNCLAYARQCCSSQMMRCDKMMGTASSQSEHRLLQKLEYEDKGEYFTHL